MENTIGIDMGLKSFFTDDSGEEVEIPQHYRKAEKRLKRLQRSLSHKKKGSNRRKKAIKRVAKAYLKVSNTRTVCVSISVGVCHGKIARTRAGKPDPLSGLGKVTIAKAPASGTRSKFASSSI
jgi:ElaB/YqjD/DUF883 family membrane-anchored ribosome-binding protein